MGNSYHFNQIMRNIFFAAVLLVVLNLAADAADNASTQPAAIVAPVAQRVANRTFPSVFMAWNHFAENLKGEDQYTDVCRHDLIWAGPEYFGLKFVGPYHQLSTEFTPKSIQVALKLRAKLLAINPNLIMLVELRHHDVTTTQLPADSPWFLRKNGQLIPKKQNPNYFLLDEGNPDLQAQVAKQAMAVMDSGAVDGIMLDWWLDDTAHLNMIKKIRSVIGEDALIIGNVNDRQTPMTAAYLNGYFMEGYRSKTVADWNRLAATVEFGQQNLKQPRLVCLETWNHGPEEPESLMRATTTMSLTLSDGYCLFSLDSQHRHDWYDFWNKSLGKPTAKGTHESDGSCRREFDYGTVVYNPMGNGPVTVKFAAPHQRLSTKETGQSFTVPPEDGDIFLVK
jgi:putative glycosyl hydrolase-like family 15 (GHL15) protein